MRYTTLNNNEIMPSLGIGTYRIHPTDAERSVEHALKNGYQLSDTANIYLNSPGSSVQIELTYNYDAEPYNVGNGFSHLGVTVSDLEKMHEVCKASAYETGELKGLSGGTTTYFFVTDPDGYRIEVKREK